MFLIRKLAIDLVQNMKDSPTDWKRRACELENKRHHIYLEFYRDGFKGGIYKLNASNYDLKDELTIFDIWYITYHARRLFPKSTLIPTKTNNPELFI